LNPVQFSEDLFLLFASPVIMRAVDRGKEMNAALAAMLLAEREANPAPSTSSIRGWQSNTDLARRETPELEILTTAIYNAMAQLTATDLGKDIKPGDLGIEGYAWGNILDHGGMTHIHNHASKAHWSAVYFVSAEAGETAVAENGHLVLVDPRPIQVISGMGEYRQPVRHFFIPPMDGSFVLFPAWMNHYVCPYFGEKERITIAYNASIDIRPSGQQSRGQVRQ